MKNYLWIVLNRVIEIVSRFFFLGQCLRIFNLEEYGVVSYKIAFYQFFTSVLYSGTLQSLSRYSDHEDGKQRRILTSLFLVAIGLTGIFYGFAGTESAVFMFYSLLYILNGWYGARENPILFSTFRSLAFLAQAILFTLDSGGEPLALVFKSFWAASLILLLSFPFRSLDRGFLPVQEWKVFFKFQLHNLSFQLTKIAERWALLYILDQKSFGLYSSIRDLLNAGNLTFFSPIYQTCYKRLTMASERLKIMKQSILGITALFVSGMLGLFFLDAYVLKGLEVLGVSKFSSLDLYLLVALFSGDLLRSVYMMLFESKERFQNLYESHFIDFLVLSLSLTLVLTSITSYGKLFVVLFSRLVCVNLYFRWKQQEL